MLLPWITSKIIYKMNFKGFKKSDTTKISFYLIYTFILVYTAVSLHIPVSDRIPVRYNSHGEDLNSAWSFSHHDGEGMAQQREPFMP